MKVAKMFRFHEFQPLLALANEELTAENWRPLLWDFNAWQFFEIGIDPAKGPANLPKIDGLEATLPGAKKLREGVLTELLRVVNLSSRELGASDRHRVGKAWAWRKALILPTGDRFFEDAGEGFRFLLERLEYKIMRSAFATLQGGDSPPFAPAGWDDEDLRPRLHLGACSCGCGKFFLWEGNWPRKQRKFFDDEHRMKYHNERNTGKKRELAYRERKNGNPAYYK